jgi:hypothetical protein
MSPERSPWVSVLLGAVVGALLGIVGATLWAYLGLETESADAAVVMAPFGGAVGLVLGAAIGFIIWALRPLRRDPGN